MEIQKNENLFRRSEIPMNKNHVVVWIDHREAHVLFFEGANEFIGSNTTHTHLHHKANEIGSGNAPEDRKFFDAVVISVADINEVLLVGPGSGKNDFVKYVREHYPALAKRIVGSETVDHPTDPQVVAYAKKYFARIDSGKFAHT
jgi:stalled ribosome rescue protein Dom34